MKNILAENLLRFSPKNLTESEKKNLSKLTEQADETNSNITLTDQFKNISTAPDYITSLIGYVSLPKKGFPEPGDVAIKDGKAVLLYLNPKTYMVLGNIGSYDGNSKTVTNEQLNIKIFVAEPWSSNDPSTGRPVNVTPFKYNLTDLPGLTATIAKFVNGNNIDAAAKWLQTRGKDLIGAFNMAKQYGLETSILNNQVAYNNAVKAKLTS
jgi:hypothetical protein